MVFSWTAAQIMNHPAGRQSTGASGGLAEGRTCGRYSSYYITPAFSRQISSSLKISRFTQLLAQQLHRSVTGRGFPSSVLATPPASVTIRLAAA